MTRWYDLVWDRDLCNVARDIHSACWAVCACRAPGAVLRCLLTQQTLFCKRVSPTEAAHDAHVCASATYRTPRKVILVCHVFLDMGPKSTPALLRVYT